MKPKRPGKQPGPLHYAGDVETKGGFRSYLIEFIDWTRAMHYAEPTVKNRRIEMGYFIDWCEQRSVTTPHDVTRAMLERYRQYIFTYRRKTDGLPLSFQTQGKRLITVRMFFKWMTRQHHLLFNPASEMDLPRQEQRLPRYVLTVAEIAQILNATDIDEPSGFGIRDRAMLETLYSTGMRRAELVGLDLTDLDTERGTVLVRQGKGKKDRMVPIGERALAWIARYREEVRPRYLDDDNDPTLFLSKHYERLSGKQLSGIVKRVIDRTNLERVQLSGPLNSSCHLFRHACATHMLENGADIRYIQALLGHAELTTTEVYTRVAIVKLKEVHTETHPARLQGRGAAQSGAARASAAGVRETLLDALDADATDDESDDE
jgi:integrase/recombinase XerD